MSDVRDGALEAIPSQPQPQPDPANHAASLIASDSALIEAAMAQLARDIPAWVPHEVAGAARYTWEGKGKRLRGVLVTRSFCAARGTRIPDPGAVLIAAAAEVLHAYSLAHDDLPCMDDDDVRRGRPATHIAFGVSSAMAGGVVTIPLVLAALTAGSGVDAARAAAAELLRAAGAGGMIGGQLADLRAEQRACGTVALLESIHARKTGALISACCRAGGIAAGAPEASILALGTYGNCLGLAFQIVDDVLDVTSTTANLGKTAGRDAALSKSTYPGLLGVDEAMTRARRLVCDARAALQRAALQRATLLTPELAHVADLILTRTH